MVHIVRRTGPKREPLVWDIPIEPVPYAPKPIEKLIATWDTETDPFLPGRIVAPFVCGFHVPSRNFYKHFWGENGLCIRLFFAWLKEATAPGGEFEGVEFLVLCHNFGNFDAYFMIDYLDSNHSPFIINGRLVRVVAQGHEFRDSYSMIPVALGDYDKGSIDYRCMEKGFRDVYRGWILIYLMFDCVSLGKLVVEWYSLFGNKLTMASVALPMLRSYHGFENCSETVDRDMRPYYFGGRNQCFATGVIEGDFHVYDINSSYPDVMRRYNHPISDTPRYEKTITERTHFAYIRAWSLGALPVRTDSGGLDFPIGTRDFYACIHEIKAGLETKTLRILKVYHSVYYDKLTNFAEFIDHFYEQRMIAAASDDEIRKLFYKLVMNSSYGKFAQDPRKYENWLFDPDSVPKPSYCAKCHDRILKREARQECERCDDGTDEFSPWGWYLHTTRDGRNIYASPQRPRPGNFYNVATAASITSAARASLLYGINAATRPLYCDTDSIICEKLSGSNIVMDDKLLGAWKTEAHGDTVCIAGKKLYAVFDAGECIKKASKGVKLTASEIRRVCDGDVISYPHPVPKFKLDGTATFVTRNIRRTG